MEAINSHTYLNYETMISEIKYEGASVFQHRNFFLSTRTFHYRDSPFMWHEGAKFTRTKQRLLWCEHTEAVADFLKLEKHCQWAKSSVHILLDM
jgi:hypothetical protein